MHVWYKLAKFRTQKRGSEETKNEFKAEFYNVYSCESDLFYFIRVEHHWRHMECEAIKRSTEQTTAATDLAPLAAG